jgi:predicted ArsR family transcriptional regulator
MDDAQREARALADPTRHAVYRHIADATAPVRVADLAASFAVHPNAIRQHLAKLEQASLVIRSATPTGATGRPAATYVAAPTEGQGYEHLARLLAEVIRTGDQPYEVGRRRGRTQAEATRGTVDATGALVEEMARLGFEPSVTPTGSGDVEIALHHCPFAGVAREDPAVVCALHEGIAAGIGEALGGIEVQGIEAHDPRRQPCLLRVRPR